jgi:outer membrane protein TolC
VSIIELSQAQLNKTAAQIASVSARYEYQLQLSRLSFEIGGNAEVLPVMKKALP